MRTSFAVAAGVLVALLVAAGPPSGRPPVGPLERYEPRMYDFNFRATLQAEQLADSSHYRYKLDKTPVMMPIIFLGTFSRVDAESVGAQLWLENRAVNPQLELKTEHPFNTPLATLHINQFNGQQIRWQVNYSTQVWSSRINDEAAARIPWPEEWPEEALDGLVPQMYIESDDPIFKQAVDHVSQGHLRSVSPYLAAKDLIRYCVNEIQTTGDGLYYGYAHSLIGMELVGASETARTKLGSPHDLVCVCVAVLRAAGIPARPVIGAAEDIRRDGRERTVFVTWAEFYLPEAGWIPFDPYVMRGKGIRTMDVRRPWPEFGTMKDLNRRIPLAYHFLPSLPVQAPRSPAVWGWDPQPRPDVTGFFQVQLTITSRGLGRGE